MLIQARSGSISKLTASLVLPVLKRSKWLKQNMRFTMWKIMIDEP